MSRWVAVTDPIPQDFPVEPAVYAVLLDGEVVYVGSTTYLRTRMQSHGIELARYSSHVKTPWGWFHADRVTVKYSVSKKYGDWAMRELRLIRRLQPRFNIRGITDKGGSD